MRFDYKESVSGFRVLLSAMVASIFVAIEPLDVFVVQFETYPLCLLVASAALHLAVSVSMTSIIRTSLSVHFLVVQQFVELKTILIGQTLNPIRFTTFREAVLSFVGFSLAIPAQIVFLVFRDFKEKRSTDEEPFQIGDQPEHGLHLTDEM
jgi:hypothetical protein